MKKFGTKSIKNESVFFEQQDHAPNSGLDVWVKGRQKSLGVFIDGKRWKPRKWRHIVIYWEGV